MAVRDRDLSTDIAGFDALDRTIASRRDTAPLWSNVWPKIGAVALTVSIWQILIWVHWKPTYALPPPLTVARELARITTTGRFWTATATTGRRAVSGYLIAVGLGVSVGVAVARFRVLRVAVGSLITGLQTMPSIAWFPLAILLFKLSEHAITFVVLIGAAPSIANGIIAGVDHVPPLLLRAGRTLGARGFGLYRHVVLPAALPACLTGLKQGWAFAWRSLMAGELLVIIANRPSLGASLQYARELNDAPALLAYMIVILTIGIALDIAFNQADRTLRRHRGLTASGP